MTFYARTPHLLINRSINYTTWTTCKRNTGLFCDLSNPWRFLKRPIDFIPDNRMAYPLTNIGQTMRRYPLSFTYDNRCCESTVHIRAKREHIHFLAAVIIREKKSFSLTRRVTVTHEIIKPFWHVLLVNHSYPVNLKDTFLKLLRHYVPIPGFGLKILLQMS